MKLGARGVEEGAELVVDGRPFVHPDFPDGFYLGVSLFDHVKPGMDIYNEELLSSNGRIHDEMIGIVR